MRRRLRAECGIVGVLVAAAALLLGSAPAAARPKPVFSLLQAESAPNAFAAQRSGISLAQATAIATSRFQGRVVRAETVSRGDRVVHEIRILGDDGRVRTVRIDAQTGSFL
jgi:hypothetical protein